VNAPTTVSAPVVNAPATVSAIPSSGCGVSPIVVSGQSGIKYNVYVVQQPADQKGGKRNTKTRKNKNSKAQK
jgi:hypothetical protein